MAEEPDTDQPDNILTIGTQGAGRVHLHNPKRGSRFDIVSPNCVHLRYRPQDHYAQEPQDLAASPASFAFYVRHNGFIECLKAPEGSRSFFSSEPVDDGNGGLVHQTMVVAPDQFTVMFTRDV